MTVRRRFAQHFLEAPWIAKLIDAIQPSPVDRFLEIGPGRGALTLPLAARVARILAVEVDRDLAAELRRLAPPNVSVVTADALAVDLTEIVRRDFQDEGSASPRSIRVAGNLPYNVSSPILFRLLESSRDGLLHDATLMLQQEVADRLVATPGTGEYGVLTLMIQLGADVKRLLSLPPGAFRPVPKVRSSVVRLTFHPPPDEVRNPALVKGVIRAVFTQRRKTLANALAPFAETRGASARDVLAAANIDPRRRPETLTLLEFAQLADALPARSGTDKNR